MKIKDNEELIDSRIIEQEDLKIIGPKIANNIIKLRARNGLSQEDLIRKTDLFKIKEIEEAKKMISLTEATILARIFNVSVESIILGESL